jgi:DNA polymerase III delta prime subunit
MKDVFVEQQNFFQFISSEIKNNKLSHAYLIETNNYKNTDELVKEVLKLILCKDKVDNNDCDCNLCSLVENELYPDIKYIYPDGNYIKKEQLIELKEQFQNKSVYENKQIYVISDATKLNSSSANTILKFLEEPEENIIAILIANSRYKVIDTIVSRCQILSLKTDDNTQFSDEIKNLAVLLCDKNKNFRNYDDIIELVEDKKNFIVMLKEVEQYIFSLLGKNEFLSYNDSQIIKIISIIEKTNTKCEYNTNFKLILDDLLVQILEV